MLGFPCGSVGKNICLQCGRPGFDPWVGKIPWRRESQPTPVFWPGEFHGLHSPWGSKELDTSLFISSKSFYIYSFYIFIYILFYLYILFNINYF